MPPSRLNHGRTISILFLILFLCPGITAQSDLQPALDLSTALEINAAMRRATAFLATNQAVDGSWSNSPATTAICLMAMIGVGGDEPGQYKDVASKARGYLVRVLRSQLPENIPSTSRLSDIAAIARLAVPPALVNDPADHPLIQGTRQPLMDLRASDDDSGMYTRFYLTAKMHRGLEVANGVWRSRMGTALLARQLDEGQWQGVRGVWGEEDANLCTAYAILAMTLCVE